MWIRRMQAVNSLWMEPEFYRVAFQVPPHEPRHERVASGCEACILSMIGGNIDILQDLWVSVYSRKKKGAGPEYSELKDLLDCWISWKGERAANEVVGKSFGKIVRGYRRALQKERHLKREAQKQHRQADFSLLVRKSEFDEPVRTPLENGKAKGKSNLPVIEVEHEDKDRELDDDYDECRLISYYGNLTASSHSLLPNSARQTLEAGLSIHPAFRASILSLPNSQHVQYSESDYPEDHEDPEDLLQDLPQDLPPRPRAPTPSSVYSRATYVPEPLHLQPGVASGSNPRKDAMRPLSRDTQYTQDTVMTQWPTQARMDSTAQHRADTYSKLVGNSRNPRR